ncbi:tetraacyldisaccharide 4'-kinase [Polaribacter porphyrae]|uniref:Tetraacyldisaccharide 4'-kinase n=1 Tax=Polaribacter porphyrae TaxID=1137780 RepID=A0A2S7WJV7_9FLAO|nr:tetraacyldisaccharide 4'-kinase [Polaribacter porphyrae]PQJ77884.1 tetraacyldisaccharide 4'-kinase [Polaribacter porphyrae]
MRFLRILLFPFAIIYDIVTTIRNYFFDINLFKSTDFKIPIVVVGNLNVGGTGKTPQIEYLIRLLKNSYKTAILSRGYKRETTDFVLINKEHTYKDVGDEPLQYFRKFLNVTVAVDANRVRGVQNLVSLKSPEVILLDDAYQHRKIKGSFYILLTKYDDLFTDDFLLPTGNLRESRRGAKRADVILVTKCPNQLVKSKKDTICNTLSKYNKNVFFTTISYADDLRGCDKKMTIHDLKNYEVLLITGIANPEPLLDFLNNKQITFKHLAFSDHHNFTNLEIVNIQQKFDAIKSEQKIILTTEKDYVRLVNKIENLTYIEIETVFIDDDDKFDDTILSHIKQNRC